MVNCVPEQGARRRVRRPSVHHLERHAGRHVALEMVAMRGHAGCHVALEVAEEVPVARAGRHAVARVARAGRAGVRSGWSCWCRSGWSCWCPLGPVVLVSFGLVVMVSREGGSGVRTVSASGAWRCWRLSLRRFRWGTRGCTRSLPRPTLGPSLERRRRSQPACYGWLPRCAHDSSASYSSKSSAACGDCGDSRDWCWSCSRCDSSRSRACGPALVRKVPALPAAGRST